MRMGVSLAARKHPVLTTLRDTKAQVTPVGEVALSIPSGTKKEVVMISSTSGRASQKASPGRGQYRMKGTALMLCWQSQLLGFRAEKSGRGDSGRGAAPNYAPRLPSSRLIPLDQMTRSQKRRWQRRNLMARRMGVEYSESPGLVGKPKKSRDKEQSQNKEPEGKSKWDMDQILLP
nr:cytochrome c biogenesis CcmF C-terminal-like mitochondrial protein [Tanacetum cinerariifolium]